MMEYEIKYQNQKNTQFPSSENGNKFTYGYDFLKEKELYEKTMDEIYAKRYILIKEIDGFLEMI